jgi:hypothetical protein
MHSRAMPRQHGGIRQLEEHNQKPPTVHQAILLAGARVRPGASERRWCVGSFRGIGDGPRRTYRDRRRHPRVQPQERSDHKRQGALGYRLLEETVPTPDGGMADL